MVASRSISIVSVILAITAVLSPPGLSQAESSYGPVNLLKTLSTPFGPQAATRVVAGKRPSTLRVTSALSQAGEPAESVPPIALPGSGGHFPKQTLSERLVQSRLYLPGRMVLGRPAEFTIKGHCGAWVALAMADRDTGARPIYGHPVRLGPDRKVVSVGRIPESGILSLFIETPIEGDLVGQYLFFEAAVWSVPDFSDLVIATTITSEGQSGVRNGVKIASEPAPSRGLKIGPDSSMPLKQRLQQGQGTNALDSGSI